MIATIMVADRVANGRKPPEQITWRPRRRTKSRECRRHSETTATFCATRTPVPDTRSSQSFSVTTVPFTSPVNHSIDEMAR